MALDTEQPQAASEQTPLRMQAVAVRLKRIAEPAEGAFARFSARVRSMAPARFMAASLRRRLLAANLLGFLFLIGGLLYLSKHNAWLIEAKRESLESQGRIIAAAIAGEARLLSGQPVIDPEKLPEAEGSRIPFRDDGFASLKLSIDPEQVEPLIRRLLKPMNSPRARIYGLDGTLIVDTERRLSVSKETTARNGKLKTRDFWTRFTQWLIDKQLPVYKEIGTANGTAYSEVRAALQGKSTAMLLLDEDGDQIVSTAEPIRRAGSVHGVLLLSTRPGDIDKLLWEERSAIIAITLLALFAAGLTAWLLARMVAEPMRRLSEAAEHVSRNISARKEIPEFPGRTDEVGQMAAAFRSMTAALYKRIENSEKFAADVAHELKNPLAAARSTAETLAYAKTVEERDQLVKQIQNELKRLNRLISDVSNASRLDAELARKETKPVNVADVMSNTAQIFRDILGDDPRKIVVDVSLHDAKAAFSVYGDEGRLAQVITNLIDNALSFSPADGTVKLSVRRDADDVFMTIEDQGSGIPEDRLKIIFDRFYTDRPQSELIRGKNSGLGLSISREIVLAYGGEIWAENCTPAASRIDTACAMRGARFVVRLPAAHDAQRGGVFRGRIG